MSEVDPLPALAGAASILEWPLPPERDDAVCDEAARLVDWLFARVARGRGALDVAMGEGLHALGQGDRTLRLGYAGIGDYARERLGIPASTAVKMARLSRELRARPLLRAAVLAGEVTARRAATVLAVAVGEEEAAWVERARSETVRSLRKAVERTGSEQSQPGELPGSWPDEPWDRIRVPLGPEQRAVVDAALDLAGKLLGAAAPRWQRVEVIAEEYLGAHGMAEEAAPVPADALRDESLETLEEWLERESAQWAFLDRMDALPAPVVEEAAGAAALDASLKSLSGLRDRWDQVFGHLALIFRALEGWRRLGFASFDHYCAERLGMAGRTVAQRAALERTLREVPALGTALREGKLSYEKARLLASHLDRGCIEAFIDRAAGMTCIGLRRALEDWDDAQMCARGELVVRGPGRVCALFAAACAAVRKRVGRFVGAGECMLRMSEHFIETWGPALRDRPSLQKEVLARDRGLCRVPGCSRAAAHAHHIVFRSRGGADEAPNLVSLCAAHHLHGVHRGWVRVEGEAPGALRWRLGS
ncbi:MAG TPA: HNH endonuclease signature motif containing protein [Myxococcales bacterium]|nr:HNH endonuclease signature motif containing protein [Myxococcales bacterium]